MVLLNLNTLCVFVVLAVVGVDAIHPRGCRRRSTASLAPETSSTQPAPQSTQASNQVDASSSTQPAPQPTPVGNQVGASSLGFTPNNIKAGISAGDAYPFMKDHIGWWYDWSPNPSKPGSPIAVPMLWGGGTADAQDAQRLRDFSQLTTVPPYVLGFEEPDCPSGSGSAGMSVDDGVKLWESLMAPMKKKGAKLGSPSMCKQADEDWLREFKKKVPTDWDFTNIHINKNNLDGVKKVVEHYLTYGKPIWVTEFACVNDVNGFVPCTNQNEINNFINTIVPYMQNHPQIYAYAYSNGLGLGDVWPLMKGDSLSESGQTYLNAIKQYH